MRGKSFRDHHQTFWQKLRDDALEAEQEFAALTEDQQGAQVSPVSGGSGPALTSDMIAQLAANTMPLVFPTFYEVTFLSIVRLMKPVIAVASGSVKFITSDKPCILADPEISRGGPFASLALASPTIEITMPVTPDMCLVFTKADLPHAYVNAPDGTVQQFNRLIAANADSRIVISGNHENHVLFGAGFQFE